MKNTTIFVSYGVAAGVVVAATATLRHPQIAAVEFICFVLIGAALALWLRRFRPHEAATVRKRSRADAWFGWLLILGALLRLFAAYSRASAQHQHLSAGAFLEFAFELVLAWFLLVPVRRKTDITSK